MKRTAEEYRAAAQGLAYSLAIKLRTRDHVESWLATLDDLARHDEPSALERELLSDAWKRLLKSREEEGVCIDCGYGEGHDPLCPQYQEPQP